MNRAAQRDLGFIRPRRRPPVVRDLARLWKYVLLPLLVLVGLVVYIGVMPGLLGARYT